MSGGGGADKFVFQPGFGRDTIADFSTDDTLQIDHLIFADRTALLGAAKQIGADTVITVNPLDIITLKNFTASSLSSALIEFT